MFFSLWWFLLPFFDLCFAHYFPLKNKADLAETDGQTCGRWGLLSLTALVKDKNERSSLCSRNTRYEEIKLFEGCDS